MSELSAGTLFTSEQWNVIKSAAARLYPKLKMSCEEREIPPYVVEFIGACMVSSRLHQMKVDAESEKRPNGEVKAINNALAVLCCAIYDMALQIEEEAQKL